MIYKELPILHVDGSLSEYVDRNGVLNKIGGVGGFLVKGGKVVDRFSKTIKNLPHMNRHEEYAIIEGLKWLKEKKISSVRVKTDSLTSIQLFENQKRNVVREDKFFLIQFLMFEFSFDVIELQYCSRNEDDESHKLSRVYIKDIPEDALRIHHFGGIKKGSDIKVDATGHTEKELRSILLSQIKQLQNFLV